MAALLYYVHEWCRCTCCAGNNCLYGENGRHGVTVEWTPTAHRESLIHGEDSTWDTAPWLLWHYGADWQHGHNSDQQRSPPHSTCGRHSPGRALTPHLTALPRTAPLRRKRSDRSPPQSEGHVERPFYWMGGFPRCHCNC